MKIFISWSGETSNKIAEILKRFMEEFYNDVEIFLSSHSIEKGTRPISEISKELENCNYGLICLTKTNLDAPWILYEAGALSKFIETSRIVPLLFGVSEISPKNPLNNFQGVIHWEKEDEYKKSMKKLFYQIKDKEMTDKTFDVIFEKFFPDFKDEVEKLLEIENKSSATKDKTQKEKIDEVIEKQGDISYSLNMILDLIRQNNEMTYELQKNNEKIEDPLRNVTGYKRVPHMPLTKDEKDELDFLQ
ncbi:MAG: toll/interleukin-1 receptor domain-containing protein [Oscillospiraceae bacterium]|jgi:hypothetical protein|nr:toll/interleukin-1 receptor domain-containing protein [Oscillospiraceae bacterium]